MVLDEEACYRIITGRDPRFDGWFVRAVTSTGVYCRPSCPAMTPKQANTRFFRSAAAAQHAGFRACRRCRPDAVPGSPEWDQRADLVGRAMRAIADGGVDRDGVAGLARGLGVSERHLHRLLVAEVGAGPLALARAQRAHTARLLVESSDLSLADVAFAAGFGSVRQFNETLRTVYACRPGELRAAARAGRGSERAPGPERNGHLTVRLAARAPFDAGTTVAFLAPRVVPGVEAVDAGAYRRTLRLPHGPATVSLRPAPGAVTATLRLGAPADLAPAVARCRRLFGLDADPVAVDGVLRADPALAPHVDARPGLRVPGHPDGTELAVRAVLGQQVSVAGARTLAARLVERLGDPLPDPDGVLTHSFPTAGALADAPDDALAMPAARRRALRALCGALACGAIDLGPGADRAAAAAGLQSVAGIGAWTAGYVALRALNDPDAFLAGDLGVRRGAARAGLPSDPGALARHAERWRPFRAHAVVHLWALA